MKRLRNCIFLFVAVCLMLCRAGAVSCIRCQRLREAGFPDSYCTALCALSLCHPNWTFEPLLITELSRTVGENYDFSFVLEKECEEKERSLVSSDETYLAYRHKEVFRSDTGSYRASREAVAYFLDPRNHLSEDGVFQFLSLSPNGQNADAVKAALCGSALEGKVSLEWLISQGEERGVDPLFCAVRLVQEQGTGGSPLLFGTAGDYLAAWYCDGVREEGEKQVLAPSAGFDRQSLLALNGAFNPFHVSSSGDGAFWVYWNGASHAKLAGWDTLEKGLVGGVEKLAGEYITRYQNTLYLQKWNVDPRSLTDNGQSRNFWAQYMQNIGAAKTEADRLAGVYRQMGLTGLPLHFFIPVYEGLPAEPCSDPAQGSAELFASNPIRSSEHQYALLQSDTPAWNEGESEEVEVQAFEKETSTVLPWVWILFFLFLGIGVLYLFFFAVELFYPILLPDRFAHRTKQTKKGEK